MNIVRPLPHEVPWQLLGLAPPAGSEDITRLMRIAKSEDGILGGYLLEEPHGESGVWRILRLAVRESARRQGLGYYLVGHATGVAESRGATEIRVECQQDRPAWRLFCRYGYQPVASGKLCFFTYGE